MQFAFVNRQYMGLQRITDDAYLWQWKLFLHNFVLQYINHETQAVKKFSDVNFSFSLSLFLSYFFNYSKSFGGHGPLVPPGVIGRWSVPETHWHWIQSDRSLRPQ